MFSSTALEARPPFSGEFSLSHLSPFSVNLLKAGQAWSMTSTGNQRYLVFKSAKQNLKVKDTLKMLPWGDKVSHFLVEVNMPPKSFEGTEEEYRY